MHVRVRDEELKPCVRKEPLLPEHPKAPLVCLDAKTVRVKGPASMLGSTSLAEATSRADVLEKLNGVYFGGDMSPTRLSLVLSSLPCVHGAWGCSYYSVFCRSKE
jgi:hypothetical protein